MFGCSKCDGVFTERSSLRRHLSTIHRRTDLQQPSIQCPLCGKTFTRQDALKRHAQIHLSGRQHHLKSICPICATSVSRSDHVKKHRRTCLAKLFANPERLSLIRDSNHGTDVSGTQFQPVWPNVPQLFDPEASRQASPESDIRFKNHCPPDRDTVRTAIESEIVEAIAQKDLGYLETLLNQATRLGSSINDLKLPQTLYSSIFRVSLANGTPLHWACCKRDVRLVQCLLDRGADAEQATQLGYTPFHLAAKEGAVEVVRVLIAAGADMDQKRGPPSYGKTALETALYDGNMEMAQLLINAGADIDPAIDFCESSVLNKSLDQTRADCVRQILKRVTSSDNNEQLDLSALEGLLMSAIRNGRHPIIEQLVHAGISLETEHRGETPLSLAISLENRDIARLLLESGALPDGSQQHPGLPLQRAYYPSLTNYRGDHSPEVEERMVELLLQWGASLDRAQYLFRSDPKLQTSALLRVLVDATVDLDAGQGWLLTRAVSTRDEVNTRILLERGASSQYISAGLKEELRVECVESLGSYKWPSCIRVAVLLRQYGLDLGWV